MTESVAAIFEGVPGQVTLRRFPTPAPRPGETLVRVLGCTICVSDLHSLDGRRSVPVPTVLGHEIVGEIVAHGADSAPSNLSGVPLQVGQRVTWAIVAPCGNCFFCRRDLPQKCRQATKFGHEPLRPGYELLGGMAEHCLLARGTSLVPLPETLSLSEACPANCATATVAAALEAAGPLSGRTVCVFGAGLLGLTAAAMVDVAGGTAIVVDPQAVRRTRALSFGATAAVTPADVSDCIASLTDGFGADVVLELSGASSTWEPALSLTRIGGRIVLVGAVFPVPAVSFLPEQLIRRQLTIAGIHNYAPRHLQTAVGFLAENHQRYPFDSLVSQWIPLDQVDVALAAARDPMCIRIGLSPTGTSSVR
jgi:putative phosphonate catabolism associated alcohol dehydrogenase